MKLEYVCHACVLIDTGDIRIATDPWWRGASYCGQWHLFPKPINSGIVSSSDVILLSHGHEDHLHPESLSYLPRTATLLYPYSWYGGAREFLKGMGFADVVEAFPQKSYMLSTNTSVTYLVNSLDSIIVLESHGRVLVNINDALHSYPPKIIDVFVSALKRQWPRIDTVLCGFGGASYFPNTIHCKGKNDVEIAETREQLFAHNFCRIVHDLAPKVAVPFAADFALLGKKQQWINQIRFPRTRLSQYYRHLYGDYSDVRIEPMYSGDALVDDELVPSSPYRKELDNKGITGLISEQYAAEMAALEEVSWISELEADDLCAKMLLNIQARSTLFAPKKLSDATFSVKVTDVRQRAFFNIGFSSGLAHIQRAERPDARSALIIESKSSILRHSFASDWGGDAITIGYGCEIEVFDEQTVAAGIDVMCVRLLTRQPPASRHWRAEPFRVVRHLISSPTTRSWALRAALNRSSDYSEKKTNDVMREWLFRSKCEVCRACDLPLLNNDFAESL